MEFVKLETIEDSRNIPNVSHYHEQINNNIVKVN